MASRRSLARLQGIRGRAAVRWQEATTGGRVVIGLGAAGKVVPSPLGPAADVDADADADADADEDADDGDGDGECAYPAADPEQAAINSWSQLRERRNRQPVTIGLGLCVLAAFSGSNTVIYYASSVLADAGLSDPSLLTYAVGIPNLLGAFIALIATDKYGRRPLLLLSFGGMAACLGACTLAPVPIRPRSRGARRSSRTFCSFPARASLRQAGPSLAFDPDAPRRLSTPSI
jgi:hypothetical protein